MITLEQFNFWIQVKCQNIIAIEMSTSFKRYDLSVQQVTHFLNLFKQSTVPSEIY